MLFMGIWVPPYTVSLLCRWGWNFMNLGVWLSLSDVKQSWLRLQTNIDCIPHPIRISNVIYNSKWFSMLLCCGWAGPPLHCSMFVLVHVGVDITDLGVWVTELCCKVLAEAPNASHIHIICKWSVLAAWYAVYGHMGPTLHCFTLWRWGLNFYETWDMVEPEWCCKL